MQQEAKDTYVIWIEETKPNHIWKSGYYGRPPSALVSDANRHLYWRVKKKDAIQMSAAEAERTIKTLLECGCRARCIPPLVVTRTY